MKRLFFTVVLLTLTIVLCACDTPSLNKTPSISTTPSATNSVPSTTTPRIPDPSEYDCFEISDQKFWTNMLPWRLNLYESEHLDETIKVIIKIRSDAICEEDSNLFQAMRDFHNDDRLLTIEDVLQYPKKVTNVYMAIFNDGRIEFFNDYPVRSHTSPAYTDPGSDDYHKFISIVYQFALSPELVLPADTVVYNICCMRGEVCDVPLVGFVTDKGDYILWGNSETKIIYLLPLEKFHTIASQLSYWELPDEICDLSPYKVQMPSE